MIDKGTTFARVVRRFAARAACSPAIDAQLRAAGWHVCDVANLDLINQPDCAVREVRMKRGAGQVDYLLYADRKVVGA